MTASPDRLFESLASALAPAHRLERQIGAGGMATVYLAEEVRHRRRVAIKVLRPDISADVGAERFAREIEIAAGLQHPHIVPLLASGEAAGLLWYSMPYVEGETLRSRLEREGALPLPDAARVLHDIADAIDAAHARGVVHRDLKPENIMLSGRHALVMDFGVARALSAATGRQPLDRLTTVGMTLGTPAYMAPEQAAGDVAADHRVDVYALGLIAYEMLAGAAPFGGTSPQQVLAAQLTAPPPPLAERRPDVPAPLAELVARCLDKDPAGRPAAAEVLAAAELHGGRSGDFGAGRLPLRVRRRALAAAGGLVLLLLVVGFLILDGRGGAAPALDAGGARRLTFEDAIEMSPTLSPDGRMLAYTYLHLGDSEIRVRRVEGGSPITVIARNPRASSDSGVPGLVYAPSWSPAGDEIALTAAGADGPATVLIVPALGGPARPLLPPPSEPVEMPAWSPDASRLALVRGGDRIVTVARDGSDERLVVGEAGGTRLYNPQWSPDGRWIAYSTDNPWFTELGPSLGNTAASRLWIVPAVGGTPIEVAGDGFLSESGVWTPDSRSLLFVSNRDAVRDIWRVSLRPDGRPAAQPERLTTGLNPMTLSVSADGRRLAFTAYEARQNLRAVPIPDEVEDLVLPAGIPVTSGAQHVDGFALSPDGSRIAFTADRAGRSELFVAPLGPDGRAGEATRLTSGPFDDGVTAWSDDGWIAFHRIEGARRSAWIIREDGTGAKRVTSDTANERFPAFGPGGRLAFSSESLGVRRIMVTERRDGGSWSAPRSLGPGDLPRFTPDGSRIFAMTSGSVVLIDVATGRRDTLDALAGSMNSRTGTMLLAKADSQLMIYLRDSAGRERPVFRPSPTVSSAGGQFPEVHDGLMYGAVKESQLDVWTLELSGE